MFSPASIPGPHLQLQVLPRSVINTHVACHHWQIQEKLQTDHAWPLANPGEAPDRPCTPARRGRERSDWLYYWITDRSPLNAEPNRSINHIPFHCRSIASLSTRSQTLIVPTIAIHHIVVTTVPSPAFTLKFHCSRKTADITVSSSRRSSTPGARSCHPRLSPSTTATGKRNVRKTISGLARKNCSARHLSFCLRLRQWRI
jgi:hypothetical protein